VGRLGDLAEILVRQLEVKWVQVLQERLFSLVSTYDDVL
jgi:hypothetical protein